MAEDQWNQVQLVPAAPMKEHVPTEPPRDMQSDLTEEEMEHIRRVTAMAEEWNVNQILPAEPRKESIPVVSSDIHNELTEEELEHIRRVTAMAEGYEEYPTDRVPDESIEEETEFYSENKYDSDILPGEERIRLSWSSDKVLPEEVLHNYETDSRGERNIITTASKEQEQLTAEELEHIRRITALAEDIPVPQMAGKETIKPWSSGSSNGVDSSPRSDEPQELTEEEIEHIRRIAAMAEDVHGFQPMGEMRRIGSSVNASSGYSSDALSQVPETHDLTEEELEHIRRVTAMAEEFGTAGVTFEPIKREEEPAKEKNELTAEELEHIRRITEMAEFGGFDTYGEGKDYLESTELTKLDKDVQDDYDMELERTQPNEPFSHKTSEDDSFQQGAQQFFDLAARDSRDRYETSRLTPEEIHHVYDQAKRDETEVRLEETSEDYRDYEQGYIVSEIEEEPMHYQDRNEYEDQGDDEGRYTDQSEPDTSEELDSRILDRWSPKEDSQKERHMPMKEPSFEIKEVEDMPRDRELGKWYEEQLSFLRESMADEEEYEEYEPYEEGDDSKQEQIEETPSSQLQPSLDRRPTDSLQLSATLSPASLTPFVTPLTEQPSGPISSPAQPQLAQSSWPSRIDRPSSSSSSMSTAAQAGRFRFSGLGRFAADAFEKAKKAGEQLQAAADPSRPPPAAAESEEERLKREAAEACALLDATAPSPMAPPGMEGLSAEEQRKILAVLAEAETQSISPIPSPRPPSTPQTSRSPAPMTMTQQPIQAPSPVPSSKSPAPMIISQPPPAPSPVPSGLEELSEEEQRRIMEVIAQAEAMDAMEPRPPSRRELAPSPTAPPPIQAIPPGLEELSEEERERILAVIANAEKSISDEPTQQRQTQPLPTPFSVEQVPSTADDSEPPSEPVSVSEASWADPSSFEFRRPPAAIPRTTPLSLGPATETCIDADLSPEEERPKKDTTYHPSVASSFDYTSPVRESGYGSASTSYATELGDYAYKPTPLLDEALDQREGARSRNGSRADEGDDDFTYSDQRFSDLHDDNIFEVTQHDEGSMNVDAVEAPAPWRGGRMWTTVFEGDDGHREPAHASPTDVVEMDEVYDNFLKGGALQEIAFDSTPRKSIDEEKKMKPIEEMKPPPEIMVTVHEDRRSDSEEEESGSDDDDEYPDRVVAAPVAAPPSFEEVERERIQQEQFGKEVLQQIQAFGESANDEFDVQWAKVALAASKEKKEPPTSVELSSQQSQQPLDVSAGRKNPFLDSPEEEDVSVDMEELDLTSAARIYQGVLSTPSHRPVYTIPEDDSEDDGTATNSDSRLHAREKRRLAARSVADHIIQLSFQTPAVTVAETPEVTATTSSSLFTSSYLFSTAPFVLPTSSPPTFTSARMTVAVSEEDRKAAELNSSIDKTLSDIHTLLDTCAVYSSEKNKPNLLCYTGSSFENKSLLQPSEECTSCSPSPSFLLPLSATLGQNLEEEESPSRGLRRSPGMMLPPEKMEQVPPEPHPRIFAEKEKMTFVGSSRKEEDDVPAAVQDMGRRKLPSIPSQPAYSTTTTYPAPPPGAYVVPHADTEPQRLTRSTPAPVYLSSSAPTVSSAPSTSSFGHLYSASTQTLPNGSAMQERPSSSMSWTSTASTSKSRDPAILPGASYLVKPRIAVRQPVSSVMGRKGGSTKIPNTLARVLLKKELKEALSRRKEVLEACEIEANQRQYIVHRMLVTGLLPEGREDDTPNVIPCLLPVELIDGARVIPKKTCSVATQKSEDEIRAVPPEPVTPKPPPHARASVAVQIDEPPRPSTSLRQQLRPAGYRKAAETQTDATSLPFYRETPLDRERLVSRQQRGGGHHDATSQTTDLLEATRKYFEDYDRKLRELGSRSKHRSAPSRHHYEFHDDDDALSREQRRTELSEELARRRERLWASTELPRYDEDYRQPRDYQHYGSLPRIDRSMPRDFTTRDTSAAAYAPPYSYASLPRNYERMMAPAPLEPIQIEYEQSFGGFGGRPYDTRYGGQARSMLDLSYDPPEDRTLRGRSMTYLDQLEDLRDQRRAARIYQDPMEMDSRRFTGRSLNYLDQLDDPRRTTGYAPRTFDMYGRQTYAQDTTNCAAPSGSDMLSQYATYLQREFQPTLLAADQRQPIRSRQYYQDMTAPLSDPYRSTRYDPPFDGYGTLPSAMAPLRTRYDAPLSDPYCAPAELPVYSRSENNYGARPPMAYSLDYGNLTQPRRQPPPQQFREDALSRVYASRRSVADPVSTSSDQFRFRTLGSQSVLPTQSVSVHSPRSQSTKKILLTRCYRDHNVYNDLGVRVVGGKKLRDGTLGAFVSDVNQSKYNRTMGEIKPGDQVLEWNGVLLTDKTFEEVERIVNSSSGEVEIVIRSGDSKYGNTTEDVNAVAYRATSPDRRPPVPIHRAQSNRIYDCVDTLISIRKHEPVDLGHLQVATFYDHRTKRLVVRVMSARGLKMRDPSTRAMPNPFVKIYLLPGRKVSHKRRTRFVPQSVNPEWNQIVEYEVPSTTLTSHGIELSIWDYDKFSENNALGRVFIPLSDSSVLSGVPRWYPVEAIDARMALSHLNAPLDRNMPSTNNYVPALLDIGYPAID